MTFRHDPDTAVPPRLARRLVRALAPGPLREQIDGDLAEGFLLRCRRDGDRSARRWYWRQLASLDVVRLRRELARRRLTAPRRRHAMQIRDRFRDLRLALRTLGKNPTYSAVVVLTLALAIGVNTAVFTVVNAVLLRPLPYEDSERLAMVFRTMPRYGFTRAVASYPDFHDWRRQAASFEELAAYGYQRVVHAGADGAEQWQGYRVTAGLFPLLGMDPERGRVFSAAEDQPDAEPVVMLSHSLWQQRFGGDENIVGRDVRLDDRDHVVVGVMPAGFAFPSQATSYWVPLRGDAERMERDTNFLTVIGRLAAGVTVAQAQAEMERLVSVIDAAPDGNEGYGVFVERRRDFVVRNARLALAVFSAAVAMILLVACANVANLMLVRGMARRRELAVRAALGAGRRRLAMLLLQESTLLAVAGGALGLLLCYGLVRVLLTVQAGTLPRAVEVGVDTGTLALTAALALGSGVAFGTLPALLGSRAGLAGAGGATQARATRRLQQGFVVLQLALATVLLIGSALLVSSFRHLTAVQPGFDPEGVVAGRVAPPAPPMPAQMDDDAESFFAEVTEQRLRFFDRLLARARALPGVESAGLTYGLPFGEQGFSRVVVPEGAQVVEGEEPVINGNIVAGDYLATMGIALRRGRAFTAADRAGAGPVALVNEAMASVLWPGEEAVGKRLRFGESDSAPWTTVVGVVADTRARSLAEPPEPLYYRPLAQAGWPDGMFVALRSTVPVADQVSALRRQVWQLDARVPLTDVTSARELVHTSVAEPRFRALVLSVFGVMAAALAVMGLYGVIAHTVAARTREISVRMALGADRPRVTRMVLRSGAILTAAGIAIGTLAALALTRFLAGMLFAVTPRDPASFVLVAGALAAAALLAGLLPARRAMRVDPCSSLRGD